MSGTEEQPAQGFVKLAHNVPKIGGDVLDIEVGTGAEAKVFQIHKDVLEKSPFFKSAVKPEWTVMRGNRPIDLTGEDPDEVDVYFNWLYSYIIRVSEEWKGVYFARLYILGEKLLHAEFQDAVMDAMIRRFTDLTLFPSRECITTIYEGTVEGSPARRLMVDLWTRNVSSKNIHLYQKDFPQEFMWDCLKVFVAKNPFHNRPRPGVTDSTLYHIGRVKKDQQE